MFRRARLGVGTLLIAACATVHARAADLLTTVRTAEGVPISGAVVYLESPSAARLAKPLPDAKIAQRGRQFVPQVLVVTRGTAVEFPNEDTVRHHVYSFSRPKKFELKLYTGTPANPVVFDKSGVVVLGCNIHDNMTAWILVVDTPYFAVTGSDGLATIAKVPDGDYLLRAWTRDMTEDSQVVREPVTLKGAVSRSVTLRGAR